MEDALRQPQVVAALIQACALVLVTGGGLALFRWQTRLQASTTRAVDIYGRFLEAVASNDHSKMTMAKTVLAIYGAPEVVARFSQFRGLPDDQAQDEFVAAVAEIRRRLGVESVSTNALRKLFFTDPMGARQCPPHDGPATAPVDHA